LTLLLADPSHFDGDDGSQADAYQGYESDGTPVHDTQKTPGRSSSSQRRRYHTLVSIWLRKLGSVAWAGAIRNQSRDGSRDLACAACIQHHKVYAENICRRLHLCCFGLGKTRIGPVDKESDRPFCRLELMQQFEALCGRCSLLLGYAREVASAAAGGGDEQGRGFFEYHKPSSYFGQYGDERVTDGSLSRRRTGSCFAQCCRVMLASCIGP
jgi:hypothetical protein